MCFQPCNLKAIWTVCRFKSNSQLLGTKESYLLLYSNSDCNSQLNISFLVALSCIEGKRLSEGLFILCCDFFAVYHLLIFEAIAVPHNTLVLFGSYGIVLSSEMFLIQEIASALIAGVIVVVVDWKRLMRD